VPAWFRFTASRDATPEFAPPPKAPHDPKGLRHSFRIHAIRSGAPLNLVQRWLGHASMTTTAIYLDALGEEEREIAARLWARLGGLQGGFEQPIAAVLDLRAGNDAG
jgi:hypothetical protein